MKTTPGTPSRAGADRHDVEDRTCPAIRLRDGRHALAARPGDHTRTTLPLHGVPDVLVSEDGRTVRPTITFVMDTRTRMIVGWRMTT